MWKFSERRMGVRKMDSENTTSSAGNREYSISSSGLVNEKPDSTNDSTNNKEQSFNGILSEKPEDPTRTQIDEILLDYNQKNKWLATVDNIPCVWIMDKKEGHWVGSWVPYDSSAHFRMLHSQADEIINEAYRMFKNFKYKIKRPEFKDILGMLFNSKHIDALLEYVQSLKWDGHERMDSLGRAMGFSLTPRGSSGFQKITPEQEDLYIKCAVYNMLIGPIQRRLTPFRQQFYVTFIGDQGSGKSETIMALARYGRYYSCIEGSLPTANQGREFFRPGFGKMYCEYVEIDHLLNKNNTGVFKAYLDRDVAVFNEKFETGEQRIPITAMGIATTNKDNYLFDQTGNRRIFPIFFYKQEDTPKREQYKDTDEYKYLTAPIFLGIRDEDHRIYLDQLLAEAY